LRFIDRMFRGGVAERMGFEPMIRG
jgi:hypothetical protein